MIKNSKAQQEMVGFALIVVILAVIMLVFFSFSLKKSNKFEQSYEAEAFVQAFLQHTTNCSMDNYLTYQNIQDLIFDCESNLNCADGNSSCDILNSTINNVLDKSLNVGEDWPLKAYFLEISYLNEPGRKMTFEKANQTSNTKSAIQTFKDAQITLTFYY